MDTMAITATCNRCACVFVHHIFLWLGFKESCFTDHSDTWIKGIKYSLYRKKSTYSKYILWLQHGSLCMPPIHDAFFIAKMNYTFVNSAGDKETQIPVGQGTCQSRTPRVLRVECFSRCLLLRVCLAVSYL